MILKQIKDFIDFGTVPETPYDGSAYYFDKERNLINYARLVPGYIYTFNSIRQVNDADIPTLDEYQTGSKSRKPYYDQRPIILSLGQEGPMEVGLNLKLIPLVMRKWFIRRYFRLIYPIMEKFIEDDGEFIELSKRMHLKENSALYSVNRSLTKVATEQSGLNLEFLVDKYSRSEMGNPLALIDWEFVPIICNLEYKNDGSILTKTPISYFWKKFTQ